MDLNRTSIKFNDSLLIQRITACSDGNIKPNKIHPIIFPSKIIRISLICFGPKATRYPTFPVYKLNPKVKITMSPTVKSIAPMYLLLHERYTLQPMPIHIPAKIALTKVFVLFVAKANNLSLGKSLFNIDNFLICASNPWSIYIF